MSNKNPYSIIKHRYITEKATVLGELHTSESNPSLRAAKSPKYVFKVAMSANKQEIKQAFHAIYKDVRVLSVNTVTIPRKKRRVRGRLGMKSAFKKAIITLSPGDRIEEQV